ncbi:glycerol-3-phosphate ABC transporter ATP-binding protein, partial [Mesorhizobium sp. M00.F.Ca.ET.186.01.1.1]
IVVMKDGLIQQVATPNEIYNHPVNLFVASFIGSPAMNFVKGQLSEKDGALYFDAENIHVRFPDDKAKILRDKGYGNKPAIFGIRPEDIYSDAAFMEANPFE